MSREEQFLNLVCEGLKVPVEHATSKSRKREYCEARQLASYIIRKYTTMSSTNVAALVNYKDHASVLRDEKLVPELIVYNKIYAEKVFPILVKAADLHKGFMKLDGEYQDDDLVFDFYSPFDVNSDKPQVKAAS